MTSTLVRAATALLLVTMPLGARGGAQISDPTPPPCGISREPEGFAPYRPTAKSVDVMVLPLAGADASQDPGAHGHGMARLMAEHVEAVRGVRAFAARWPGPSALVPAEAARLGREERARLVVTGALVRAGSQAAASIRVVRASDGAVLATERVEFEWGRLPAIEARLATVVRRAAGATSAGAARPLTASADALEALMLGDAELLVRDDAAPARAAEAYSDALEADATLAAAHVRLAAALAELAFRGPVQPSNGAPASLLARARQSAERAVALASRDPWAWAVRGRVAALSGDAAGARRAFAQARSLGGGEIGEITLTEGRALLDLGSPGAAEPLLVRAAERMPQRGEPLVALAELRLARGDAIGACRALNGALAIDRRNPFAYAMRGVTRLRIRENREAWGDGETALRLGRRSDGLAVLAVVDAQARDTASARGRVRSLLGARPDTSRVFSPWEARFLARAAAATGDARTGAAITRRSRPIALARFPLD